MTVNTRPRNGMRYWVLSVVGALSGMLAVGLTVVAFTMARPATGVVLETEPASAGPVVTVATSPALDVSPVLAASDNAPIREPSPQESQTGISDLAAAPVPPAVLAIEDLGIEYGVKPVGLQDNGAMEIPTVQDIGWYIHGAVPGDPGATVLVAHVWWNGEKGPFRRLGALELGATIDVRVDGGELHTYEVVERAMYDKDKLPRDLWRTTGPETLVLITCGGTFNSDTRRFEQNIVVYATPKATSIRIAS